MPLAPNEVHVDQLLTNLSIEYKNPGSAWRDVMPIIKVAKRSDLFTMYTKADSYRLPNDQIAPTALPNEMEWGKTNENYSVRDHALAHWVARETTENADAPINIEMRTNRLLNQQLDNVQEARVAAKVFTQATYPAAQRTQLAGVTQWGANTDDPIGDILTGVNTCFQKANTVIMGPEVWSVFRKLPEILDSVKGATRYQGSPGGLATIAECASMFEIDRWIVPTMRYVVGNPGQVATYGFIWGKHCFIGYVDPNPGIESITFGATFCESLRATYRTFDGKRGVKGADFFKVAWNSDEKVIAPDVAYFIEDAVA